MIKDASSDFDSSRLLPGLIYEFTNLGSAPLGPSLAAGPAPLARAVVGRERSDLARFGLGPGAEPVPGYHLVAPIGSGTTGEVWKAIGPGGFPVALKFVGLGERDAADELRSLALMKNVRHANLLTIFGTWQLDGLLVVGMDMADGSLVDRCGEAIGRGEPGIPFPELAEYMGQAARGVDFLNRPHHHLHGLDDVGLVHRDIKPQNLLLVGGSVKVGDFGLVASLEGRSEPLDADSLAPAYAPPEWSEGRISRHSDQYALAMTYCRLRVGRLPTPGAGEGRPPSDGPDLSILPDRERPVLARALARHPEDRWPDCLTFVNELVRIGSHDRGLGDRRTAKFRPESLPDESAVPDERRPGRRRLAAACLLTLLALAAASRLDRGEHGQFDRRTTGLVPVEAARVPSPLASLPDATASPPAESPATREDEASVDAVDDGSVTPPTGAEVMAAIDAMTAPARGEARRAFAALREGIASLGRESPIGGRLADLDDRWGGDSPAADADPFEDDPATGDPSPEEVRPPEVAPPAPVVERKATGPDDPSPKDRASPQAIVPARAASGRSQAEALEAARPRPATIVVLLPGANAELVVKGAVGRGNPDEWYGPRRVIHSPPLGEAKDYLIGSFWMDQAGRPQTRTKELKVTPGRSYEVDLRLAVPTSREVGQ